MGRGRGGGNMGRGGMRGMRGRGGARGGRQNHFDGGHHQGF